MTSGNVSYHQISKIKQNIESVKSRHWSNGCKTGALPLLELPQLHQTAIWLYLVKVNIKMPYD